VPCGPINDMAEVFADPQVTARDMVVELEHPLAGTTRNIGVPIKLSETPGSVRTAAPTLGQHTDAVLAEYDYAADDINGLRTRGVVR
jgi:crotonobetainyl-CoA:carnitine CoA-transferase CaiB-like acyl-CoA transferase